MWLHKFSVCLWFPTLICCLVLTSVLYPIFGSCRYVWYVTILSFISVPSFTTAECTPTMHRWPWFMLHFLSCLYACHKDFQSLKQLLCVNQPLFFLSRPFSVYCTVLYLSERSVWPVGRVGIFFLLLVHTGVWSTGSYMGIEYWSSNIGYFLISQCCRHHWGCIFDKCECSEIFALFVICRWINSQSLII